MRIFDYKQFNFTDSKQNFQNKKEDKLLSPVLKRLDHDVVSFSQKPPINDKFALYLIEQKLIAGKNGISKKEARGWVEKIRDICKKHKIKPSDLPINKEYPGNLSAKKNHAVFSEVFYQAAPNPNKIKVLS